MIKGFLLAMLSLILSGCCFNQKITPEEATRSFYQQYLLAFADFDPANAENSQLADNSSLLRQYVASGTRARIADIQQIYEQEILEADYFTYCQDYAPEWVKELKIGKAAMLFGGANIPVSIGVGEEKPLELMVYLRREDESWKIYRVRDVTHNYEQPIFDSAAIKAYKTTAP